MKDPLVSSADWQVFTGQQARVHLLQTAGWGDLKAAFGWQVRRLMVRQGQETAGAQILFRRLLPGISMAYLARGPVFSQSTGGEIEKILWQAIDHLCRRERAVFLKIEPDAWQEPDAGSLPPPGCIRSHHSIQPPRTITLDLNGSEEEILARMKQKTRYNIKLAQRKGVKIEASADIAAFSALMAVTGQRDGFGVHSQDYYQQAYRIFQPAGLCELLLARFEERVLAGLMVFAHAGRAWYLYGASSNEQRELMPTYLIQWEAMRWARLHDCSEYDLWGVPDADLAALEAGFEQRADGLWGVYRFKRGFGGEVRRSAGPWDRVYQPLLYQLYRWRTRHAGE